MKTLILLSLLLVGCGPKISTKNPDPEPSPTVRPTPTSEPSFDYVQNDEAHEDNIVITSVPVVYLSEPETVELLGEPESVDIEVVKEDFAVPGATETEDGGKEFTVLETVDDEEKEYEDGSLDTKKCHFGKKGHKNHQGKHIHVMKVKKKNPDSQGVRGRHEGRDDKS